MFAEPDRKLILLGIQPGAGSGSQLVLASFRPVGKSESMQDVTLVVVGCALKLDFLA